MCIKFAVVTVENGQHVAITQPEYATEVLCLIATELQFEFRDERVVDEESGRCHCR